jgi:hypothetical protein
MGMIACRLHGWCGIVSMTPAAADILDNLKERHSLVLLELLLDEVPFFLYSLKKELPFDKTKLVGQTFEVDNKQGLDTTLGTLVPRCGKCVNDVLNRT